VIARLAGSDPAGGALLGHAHLDVVSADAADWAVHPFSGEVLVEHRIGHGHGREARAAGRLPLRLRDIHIFPTNFIDYVN
jgi:hypothetical protein